MAKPGGNLHSIRCPQSQRTDGKHGWRFDGDDPYVVCVWCGEVRDALSDRIIVPARPAPEGPRHG